MRLAATSLVTLLLLVFPGCGAAGTPPPSAVTVTPVFLPPTTAGQSTSPDPTDSGSPTPGTSPATGAEHRRPAVRLSQRLIGSLQLGSASMGEVRTLLNGQLGKGATRAGETCSGRSTAMSWGALTVTFTGRLQVAQHWQVDTEEGTKGLQLPRGTEWRPDRQALTDRADASVETVDGATAVTLPEGLTYVIPDGEQRARFVSAGTLHCG